MRVPMLRAALRTSDNPEPKPTSCSNVPASTRAGSANQESSGARRSLHVAKPLHDKRTVEQMGEQLDPGLKEWLDNVIVPGLVYQFLAQHPNLGALVVEIVRDSSGNESAEVSP
jgi:hypothetical protein